jgi:hypothetical protein
MLRKLVIAGAVFGAAAGIGLAVPASAAVAGNGGGVKVTCTGPTFGAENNTVTTGDMTGAITATGDTLTELIHDESTLEFTYRCGNGPIENVGNRTVRIVE